MKHYKENLLDIYAGCFRANWDLPALTDYGSSDTLTYAELSRRIAYVHLMFESLGIKPGDKVALMDATRRVGSKCSWLPLPMGL